MTDFANKGQTKFYGNISEEKALIEIFQTLGSNQQHGWLFLRTLEREVCLYFQGDLVSLVTPPDYKFSFIPDKLYYAGKLSKEEYHQVSMFEKPLEILLQFVDASEIENLKNNICYEEICALFIWTQGTFEFISRNHPDAKPDFVPISKEFEIEGVLHEIAQRAQEYEDNKTIMPEMYEILVHEGELEEGDRSDPMTNVWLLADHRNITEVILLSYLSEFDAWRILNTLLLDGKLGLISNQELKSLAADFVEQLHLDQAIDYYLLLLKRNPVDLEAGDALAQCYEKMECQEELGALYRSMGETLFSSGDNTLKLHGSIYLCKFCDLFPETAEGIEMRINLFYLAIQQQIDSKAIGYNILLEGKKLFQTLRSRKDDERARQILEHLLTIAPHDKALQSQLINVCIDLNDTTTAVQQYENIAKIYERDKNWTELFNTYQKILKLVPARRDIQKKADMIQARSQRGKSLVKTLVVSLSAGILLFGGWWLYEIMKAPRGVENQQNTEEIRKKMLEQNQALFDSRAKKSRQKALAKIEKKEIREYKEAKGLLEEILQTSISPDLKRLIETDLASIHKLIIEKEEIAKSYERDFFKARELETSGLWNQSVTLYQHLWYNPKFQDVPERLSIKYPILIQIVPSEAKIFIDGTPASQEMKGQDTIVRAHPEFQKIKISLEGYEPRYFFNALRAPLEKPFVDGQGNTWEPMFEAKVEATLAKAALWVVSLSEGNRMLLQGTPCYAEGTLFVATRSDAVYAFSPIHSNSAPEKMWVWNSKYAKGSAFSSTPLYHRGILYLGGNNGKFYALDVKKQTLVGLYTLSQGAAISTSPVVSEKQGLVIFTAQDGKVYALPLLQEFTPSWKPQWIFSTQRKIEVSPILAEDMVLVGSDDSFLYAVNLRDGKEIWRYGMDRAVRCEPVVAERFLYIAGNGYLRALDRERGKEMARVEIKGDVMSAPLLSKNTLYCATNGKIVYAFSLNLKLLWEYKGLGAFQSAPLLGKKGTLYVASQRAVIEKDSQKVKIGFLHALNAQNGKLIWLYEIPQDMDASPILIGDIVVQAADKLYGFLDN